MFNKSENLINNQVVTEEKRSSANTENIDNVIKPNKTNSFSMQRYIVNVIVRSTFFLFPIPIHQIIHYMQDKQFLSSELNLPLYIDYLYIPLGLAIVVIGTTIGGVLDILLPKQYVIGGKIAVKSFNVGTLSWFEGLGFRVSLDVAASGKGIAVKEERE